MGLIKQVFFTVRKNIASFLLWVFLSAAGLAAGIYLMQTAERFCDQNSLAGYLLPRLGGVIFISLIFEAAALWCCFRIDAAEHPGEGNLSERFWDPARRGQRLKALGLSVLTDIIFYLLFFYFRGLLPEAIYRAPGWILLLCLFLLIFVQLGSILLSFVFRPRWIAGAASCEPCEKGKIDGKNLIGAYLPVFLAVLLIVGIGKTAFFGKEIFSYVLMILGSIFLVTAVYRSLRPLADVPVLPREHAAAIFGQVFRYMRKHRAAYAIWFGVGVLDYFFRVFYSNYVVDSGFLMTSVRVFLQFLFAAAALWCIWYCGLSGENQGGAFRGFWNRGRTLTLIGLLCVKIAAQFFMRFSPVLNHTPSEGTWIAASELVWRFVGPLLVLIGTVIARQFLLPVWIVKAASGKQVLKRIRWKQLILVWVVVLVSGAVLVGAYLLLPYSFMRAVEAVVTVGGPMTVITAIERMARGEEGAF